MTPGGNYMKYLAEKHQKQWYTSDDEQVPEFQDDPYSITGDGNHLF
jgi:hypothetical protein